MPLTWTRGFPLPPLALREVIVFGVLGCGARFSTQANPGRRALSLPASAQHTHTNLYSSSAYSRYTTPSMLSPALSGSMGLLGGLFLLGGVPAPAAAMNLTLAQEYAGQTFFDNFVYNVRALGHPLQPQRPVRAPEASSHHRARSTRRISKELQADAALVPYL